MFFNLYLENLPFICPLFKDYEHLIYCGRYFKTLAHAILSAIICHLSSAFWGLGNTWMRVPNYIVDSHFVGEYPSLLSAFRWRSVLWSSWSSRSIVLYRPYELHFLCLQGPWDFLCPEFWIMWSPRIYFVHFPQKSHFINTLYKYVNLKNIKLFSNK